MVVVIRRKACQRASRQVFHRRKRCLLGTAEDHHLVPCHADDVIHAVALAVVPQFGQDVDRDLAVRLAHQNFKPVVRNFLALAHPVGVGLQTDSELLLDLLLQGYGRLADLVVCKLVAENGVVFQIKRSLFPRGRFASVRGRCRRSVAAPAARRKRRGNQQDDEQKGKARFSSHPVSTSFHVVIQGNPAQFRRCNHEVALYRTGGVHRAAASGCPLLCFFRQNRQ